MSEQKPVAWFVKQGNAGAVLFHEDEVKEYLEDGFSIDILLFTADQLKAEREKIIRNCMDIVISWHESTGNVCFEIKNEMLKLLPTN